MYEHNRLRPITCIVLIPKVAHLHGNKVIWVYQQFSVDGPDQKYCLDKELGHQGNLMLWPG